MANFKLTSASDKQVWSAAYTKEYVRESGLSPYMSTSKTAIIRVDKSLGSNAGSLVHFPYFKRLTGPGVSGSTQLKGAEENVLNHSAAVRVAHVRNGVMVPEDQSFRTEIDVINVARDSLKEWAAEKLRDDLLTAGQSIILKGANDADGNPLEDTYVSYAAATPAQRNAHLVSNTDRVLVGNKRANTSSGVMATALATIDTTQKLSAGVLTMAKTMARTASTFKITPYRSDATAGREWFVLFVGPEGYRDLAVDPLIYAANKDARDRGLENNPIFQAGDMVWNGIIIREIPEMPLTGAVGNAGTVVGQSFLCGQGALALAYAKMATPRVQEDDYDHLYGVATTEIRGQIKLSAAGTQTGMVSLFHAATPDA